MNRKSKTYAIIMSKNKQIEELKAHVERLHEKINSYHDEDLAAEDALDWLLVISKESSTASLNAFRREVAELAFVAGCQMTIEEVNCPMPFNVSHNAQEYANTKYPADMDGGNL